MKRTQIINHYIEKYNYKTYLEIGYGDGKNFSCINAALKHCIDPAPNTKPTHKMTSDDFFASNKNTYDIIFIDGLHHHEQVYRDIINALTILNTNGTIVCHDMNPHNELTQIVPRTVREWTGDCWKAFVKLKYENHKLKMITIDTDYGVSIIRKAKRVKSNTPLSEELTYSNLEKNRKEWLNLVSVDDWLDLSKK